jgi:replicative DNA helicase
MRDGAPWQKWQWTKAAQVVSERANWPIWVDDVHGRTIHDLVGSMRRMSREHGVKVFVLDNLSEVVVDGQDRGEERLDRALGRIAKTYRDAAHDLGAAPVLVVHLNRETTKRADGAPRLSDLKNSGEIEDASHVVALLSRDQGSDVLKVDVAKNRNGPVGQVELRWAGDQMRVEGRAA